MYLKEIETVIAIAEEKNLTRAAEKLYITPSAVTQQLATLEKYLDTPLFHRIRGEWTLTPAGEVYVKAGREMLQLKKQTEQHIGEIAHYKTGSISVGFPPDRASEMIQVLYPIFHKKYPNYKMQVREVNVRRQQQMLASGELDLSFQVLTHDQRTGDVYIPIALEEILLAAPSFLPQLEAARPSQYSRFPELPLTAIQYEPFAQIYKVSTMRDQTDQIFRDAGIHPEFHFETSSNHTIVNIVSAGLCCGLVPDTVAQPTENVSFFSIPGNPMREIYVCYRKGAFVTRAMEDLIEIALATWSRPSLSVDPKFGTSIPGRAPESSARSD